MGSLAKRFPVYSRLLKLYPASYRRAYSTQILQTLADMLDDTPTAGRRYVVWLRAAADLPLSAAKQQVLFAGGVMARETPDYVKRSGLIGAALLAPFLVLLIANALTPGRLYHSWFWSARVLFVWIIILPTVALLISGTTFLRWSAEQRHRRKTSSWRLLTDWPHNWPMLIVLAASFGILALVRFHDSVHCLTHNPLQEAHHWHTTWRCVQNG